MSDIHSIENNNVLTTVQVERSVCPITNLALGSSDPRKVTFLVHGQKVPINSEAFVAHCRLSGWIVPQLSREPFNIEQFLMTEAKKLAVVPVGKIGDKLEKITRFAETIGLKTGIVSNVVAGK